MKTLVKTGFNRKDIVSFGNMFLLGNGRYGYRGTLEEYTSNEMVGLNVLGLYDRYQDKWRESLNLPNPFYFLTSFNGLKNSVLDKNIVFHKAELNIFDGTFSRETEFEDVIIKSTRFVSSNHKNLLVDKYVVKAKRTGQAKIEFKVDTDIYEINGPHFKNTWVKSSDNFTIFKGTTNEGKEISTYTKYISKEEIKESKNTYFIEKTMQKGDEICIFAYSLIEKPGESLLSEFYYLVNLGYDKLLKEHISNFNKKWVTSRVILDDETAQFELDYSIYHLLILEDSESFSSIPARGLSGQTYKGAVFWDTEAFILPFFSLTNPAFARNLLIYRINTLKGAKEKARGFGYDGAFYAWESQEDGLEQCSKYNVTDPITNEPIRTYFDEKQIHISGDVAIAFNRYAFINDDYQILRDGGYEVIYECAKFYMSRATLRNGQYHYNDVIGPDEYHERVNDNAFTNYIAYRTIELAIQYYEYGNGLENRLSIDELEKFKNLIFLPKPNEQGVIEQFEGYFSLEEKYPDEVKAMRRNDKEYLGGLAIDTKTIKQADVVSLLVMLSEFDFAKFHKENYDYYLPFTEHGSSLSSSMYSILGSQIGETELAYKLFRKSAGIDLGTDQKMYAGGIYIGGTHPASNAGAYISAIFGFAGLKFDKNGFSINPKLPEEINKLQFKFFFKKKLYEVTIEKGEYQLKEVNSHD